MKLPFWSWRRSRDRQLLREMRKDIDKDKDEIAAARELFEEARRRTNDAFVEVERETERTRIGVALLQDLGRGLDGA